MRRRLLGPFAILAVLPVIAGCDPAIFRTEGTVLSLRTKDDSTVVCLSDVHDVGAKNKNTGANKCLEGVPEGYKPKSGDCVVVQTQGESAMLRITRCADWGKSPWEPTTSGSQP